MDGTFHALATILHRVPRDVADRGGKRRAKAPQRDEPGSILDIPDGWIRVAL
jgi:hypothetical protein